MKDSVILKLENLTKEQLINYIIDGLNQKQIASKYNTTIKRLHNKAVELGVDTVSVKKEHNKSFNVHVFDSIDTEAKTYWLGFLFADGCVYNNVTPKKRRQVLSLALKNEDYNHIKKFKDFVEDIREDSKVLKVSTIRNKKWDTEKEYSEVRYVLCSSYLVNKLISYGCVPKKSLILKFPDESIFKERSFVFDFIRGYIDGDGSLYRKSGRLGINVLGTYDFLSGIKRYFPTFAKINERSDCHGVYQIDSSCGKANEIAMKLYANATVYLDRKFKRFATLCELYTGEKSGNIGESCDANTEITSEITQGPEEL